MQDHDRLEIDRVLAGTGEVAGCAGGGEAAGWAILRPNHRAGLVARGDERCEKVDAEADRGCREPLGPARKKPAPEGGEWRREDHPGLRTQLAQLRQRRRKPAIIRRKINGFAVARDSKIVCLQIKSE